MDVEKFYLTIRQEFPEFMAAADSDYIDRYGEFDQLRYLWFESLANSINYDMNKAVSPKKYKAFFEFIRKSYLFESEEIKKCIDVSLVENLFWQVPADKAGIYWREFPALLKDLYVSFHHKPPA